MHLPKNNNNKIVCFSFNPTMIEFRTKFEFLIQRSNEVKITERAVRLELSLQHRPDAILNLGGLF